MKWFLLPATLSPFFCVGRVALALIALGGNVLAQTWIGAGTDNNVTTAANWQGGVAPANDYSATLTFSGNTRTAPNFDSSMNPYQLGSITFASGASAFGLTGTVELRMFSGITVDGTQSHSISAPVGALGGFALGGSAGALRSLTFNDVFNVDNTMNHNAVTKSGASTLVFNGETRFNDGGLSLTGGTLAVGNGGTTGSLSGSIATAADTSVRFNRSTDSSYVGVISGAGAFTKLGAGTLTLSNASTYTGATTVTGGALRLDTVNALPAATAVTMTNASLYVANHQTVASLNAGGTGAIDLTSGKILTLNGNANSTISSAVLGAGSIVKNGTGLLTLAADNTFGGGLTVNAGALAVANITGSATGGGAVTIGSGASVGGTGRIGGALTMLAGAQISPGGTTGTLTVASATLAGGSTFAFEINDATGVAGTNWDLLSVSGQLALTASAANKLTLRLSSLTSGGDAGQIANFNPAAAASWQFASFNTITGFDSGAINVVTTDFANSFTGSFSMSQSGSGLFLDYTPSAIPEPGTYALVAGLFAMAGAVWRRR